ncbi:TPA: hypothetical protein KR289_003845, partial [Clostridioides difficile]|nr:hypothetical protein [Clostridioides difficile]
NLLSFNEKKIEKHKCKNYHNDSSKDKYKYSQSEFIAATLKEADDMNEEERRILEAEKRILETEKRVHQDNKEVKESIDKQFNDIKGIFKEYKNDLDKDRIELKNDLARERAELKSDLKEAINEHKKVTEKDVSEIKNSMKGIEDRIDSTNKWIIGLCITTIIGIATMAITIGISIWPK